MEPRAVGMETEYAQCMERRDRGLRVVDAGFLFERLEHLLLEKHRSLKANSFGRPAAQAADVQIHEGRFLDVGARFYYDTGHLEWASAETTTAQDAALYDIAAERTLNEVASRIRPPGEGSRLMIVKNNIDYVRSRTYGCHENYQVARNNLSARQLTEGIVRGLTPFLVTRQIYAGAGRVGGTGPGRTLTGFQISQRADFIEQVASQDTRSERALINLKDEALGDARRFMRLHLILGDSNRSPEANILKLGTTRVVLRLIESGGLERPPELTDPVRSLRAISSDTTCSVPVPVHSGPGKSPIGIQRWYLDRCESLRDLDAPDQDVLRRWRKVLDDLEADPMTVADRVDWAAKWKYVLNPAVRKCGTNWKAVSGWNEILSRLDPEEAGATHGPPERLHREYAQHVARHHLDWSEYETQLRLYFELRERDLRYHDLDQRHGLYSLLCRQGLVRSMFDDEQIRHAQVNAPESRARVRARIIEWALNNGLSQSTTVDWGTASLPGVKDWVAFADPCAPHSPVLEQRLSGPGAAPVIRIAAAPSEPEPRQRPSVIGILKRFLERA